MRVRTAAEGDVDAVVGIGTTTWRATYPPITGEAYVRDGIARWWRREDVLDSIRAGTVLVAEDASGRVVAMASYTLGEDAVNLWKLYVLPAAQGTGAGTALVEAVAAVAAAQGRSRVRLDVLVGNDAALAFYERRGFVATGREPDTDLGGPDTIWMERPVAPPA